MISLTKQCDTHISKSLINEHAKVIADSRRFRNSLPFVYIFHFFFVMMVAGGAAVVSQETFYVIFLSDFAA